MICICDVCTRTLDDGITLYLVTRPGEQPPVWRCRQHLEAPLPKDLQALMDVMEHFWP